MRYRDDFTLFPRKLNSGKTVWYYQTYDDEGKRTTAKSTGQTTKTAAKSYCNLLLKEGKLIPTKVPYFEDFTADWFIYDKCPYIRAQLARGKSFSRNNADMQRSNLNKHLMPEFAKLKLDKISPKKIEDWLFKLKDKGLANKTVNNNLNTLRVIFNEAERLGIIRENPVKKVKALVKNTKNRGMLTEPPRVCRSMFYLSPATSAVTSKSL